MQIKNIFTETLKNINEYKEKKRMSVEAKLRQDLLVSLKNIENLETLIDAPGWKSLEKWAAGEVSIIDNKIKGLCRHPAKNELDILYLIAYSDWIVNFFEYIKEVINQKQDLLYRQSEMQKEK